MNVIDFIYGLLVNDLLFNYHIFFIIIITFIFKRAQHKKNKRI